MVPLVYSRAYDITACGVERLHPFDSVKYRRIRDWLVRQGLRKRLDFIDPPFASHADLLAVHTPGYLRSLRRRDVLAGILEVPLVRLLPASFTRWRVPRPMRRASGGTVLACRLALGRGLAIFNRGSGRWSFHTSGLPSLNVTALAANGGYLYVGADNGLVRIVESELTGR